MKRYRWWYHSKGAVYANNFDFKVPVTEEEAMKHIRKFWKVKRLTGEIWAGEK